MILRYWLTNKPWPEDRSKVESIIANVRKVKLIAADGSGAIYVEQGEGCFIITSEKPIENIIPDETVLS